MTHQTTDTSHPRGETQFAPAGVGSNCSEQADQGDRVAQVSTVGLLGTQTINVPPAAAITPAKPRPAPLLSGDTHLADTTQTTETGTSQGWREIQRFAAGAGLGPILDDPTLVVLAEAVDDLEQVRKANENRLRQLTRCDADTDGVVRGHCLPEDSRTVQRLRLTLDLLSDAEKQAVKNLEQTTAAHPLGPWVKAQNGLGLKTIARLLSAIGDPYWNTLHDRPRTVSELWAYAGLAVHDGAVQHRVKGQKSNWSDTAKMRAWNVVQPIIKNRNSPYRALYDAAKLGYGGAVHDAECKRCGPKNKPAQPGSLLSKAHIEGRTQRVVMKRILKDLWVESKRIHMEVAAQTKKPPKPRRNASGGDLTPQTTPEGVTA